MVTSRNTHTVLAGRVYRTGQLTPDQLVEFVRSHNIRTVINLRGRPISDWYPSESRATQALGIAQEDVTTSASHLPPPDEVRRLIEVLDRSEYPVVLHCQQGADRTGLASGIALLLYSDADYSTARRQWSPRYGHFPLFDRKEIDRFFAMYEQWLFEHGVEHSISAFRRWATTEYGPGKAVAELKMVGAPETVPLGRPFTLTVRATNRSRDPWKLMAGTSVGVLVHYYAIDPDGNRFYEGRAGFFNADVPPGESVEVKLPLPALKLAGGYSLYADVSERNIDFHQYGSEPLTYGWNACDPARSPGN